MEPRDHGPDAEPLAPHPVLSRYYGRAEERSTFVRKIFDQTAVDYDAVERLVGFGMGSRYRREALVRAGLRPGMRVLDVATGTGLVAREALSLVGRTGMVVGLDPSAPMMRSGLGTELLPLIQGSAERLPVADRQFDFLTLGFALRHVADLRRVFREFHRVLRPGGIACLLEITPPDGVWLRRLLKFYLARVVPLLSHALSRTEETPVLLRYFWDTIEACAAPAQVSSALEHAGFTAVRRHVEVQVFSEYVAHR